MTAEEVVEVEGVVEEERWKKQSRVIGHSLDHQVGIKMPRRERQDMDVRADYLSKEVIGSLKQTADERGSLTINKARRLPE